MALFQHIGEIDVVAARANYCIGRIEHPLRDHNQVSLPAGSVAEAVPTGERPARIPGLVEKVFHAISFVGVLVRQHQSGCRLDGSRRISVDPIHLVRPFPALTFKPEAETANPRIGVVSVYRAIGVYPRGIEFGRPRADRDVISPVPAVRHDVTPVP
ncbi:hypothetical protein MGALJ_02500 [Mycobacterium gallinarum]|uniref:Uncharacterized protein n=1 Tax=Mycobacterium gallinarum TaxID=39689 RepID=A0A9W4FD28_9MYCO|nr:hypothetical protein MGALJ_02500 [Mycobacterium gallinarum]